MTMAEVSARVAEIARTRVNRETGRLRASTLRSLYIELANEFRVSWAAVYLRIPPEIMPTVEEMADYRSIGAFGFRCDGCADALCPDCQWVEREFGEFETRALLFAMRHASEVGGLDQIALRRELRRRERRGLP